MFSVIIILRLSCHGDSQEHVRCQITLLCHIMPGGNGKYCFGMGPRVNNWYSGAIHNFQTWSCCAEMCEESLERQWQGWKLKDSISICTFACFNVNFAAGKYWSLWRAATRLITAEHGTTNIKLWSRSLTMTRCGHDLVSRNMMAHVHRITLVWHTVTSQMYLAGLELSRSSVIQVRTGGTTSNRRKI